MHTNYTDHNVIVKMVEYVLQMEFAIAQEQASRVNSVNKVCINYILPIHVKLTYIF
jgi:hypothetical protein